MGIARQGLFRLRSLVTRPGTYRRHRYGIMGYEDSEQLSAWRVAPDSKHNKKQVQPTAFNQRMDTHF
jgi:hypothetical protein